MRAMLLVAALLVSASATASAEGSWTTGNQLKEFCHSEEMFGLGFCLGFAAAVAEIELDDTVSSWRICNVAEGVTTGQLRDIMLKYLGDHPERFHYTATSRAASAFAEAFPCPK